MISETEWVQEHVLRCIFPCLFICVTAWKYRQAMSTPVVRYGFTASQAERRSLAASDRQFEHLNHTGSGKLSGRP